MSACGTCEAEVQPGQNFCPRCGASLLPPVITAMIRDAQRAIEDDPADASARYNLAVAYRLGGLDDPAMKQFLRVSELQPDFADVHYEIGALHARAGRRQEAITSLERARTLDPEHDKARRLLEKLTGRTEG